MRSTIFLSHEICIYISMKVLKFGGTSVGSVKSLKNVKQIVESCQEPVIVVVSALGGITDKLLETAREAAAGSLDYQDNLREIIARHHDIIAGVVPEERQEEVCAQTDALLDELSNIYKGVSLIRDLSAKTQNNVCHRSSSAALSTVLCITIRAHSSRPSLSLKKI